MRSFYAQLICAQIPEAQKDSQVKQIFALTGSAHIKAALKHVDETDPGAAACHEIDYPERTKTVANSFHKMSNPPCS